MKNSGREKRQENYQWSSIHEFDLVDSIMRQVKLLTTRHLRSERALEVRWTKQENVKIETRKTETNGQGKEILHLGRSTSKTASLQIANLNPTDWR